MPEFLKKDFEATGSYTSHLQNQGGGKGQFNLVGYSYGSEVAAQEASVLTRNGVKVDHLVLIGSPISNEFLTSLRRNPLIGSVNVINLTKQGDPLYAGMPQWKVLVNAPILAGQMVQGGGHFYYAPVSPQGAANRRALARELYKDGLR
jgi:pimeloyl-ACP methyl ester carboxylesterase